MTAHHLIMEVSSQAYLKKRVYGLTFDASVFSISVLIISGQLNIPLLKTTSTTNGS